MVNKDIKFLQLNRDRKLLRGLARSTRKITGGKGSPTLSTALIARDLE